MLAALDHATGFLNHHFGDLDVARCFLVKGACDDFDARRSVALEIGDFFGTLVDQKNDRVDIRMVRRDCIGDLLQNDCFSSARRRNDQSALAKTEGRHHIDDARFDACWLIQHLEMDARIRVQRREILENR